jgi:hypothetical protein
MRAAMTARPWRIPRLLDRLADLEAGLHHVPLPDWANQDDVHWSVAERRVALARYVLSLEPDPDLARGLEDVEALFSGLVSAPPARRPGPPPTVGAAPPPSSLGRYECRREGPFGSRPAGTAYRSGLSNPVRQRFESAMRAVT